MTKDYKRKQLRKTRNDLVKLRKAIDEIRLDKPLVGIDGPKAKQFTEKLVISASNITRAIEFLDEAVVEGLE